VTKNIFYQPILREDFMNQINDNDILTADINIILNY